MDKYVSELQDILCGKSERWKTPGDYLTSCMTEEDKEGVLDAFLAATDREESLNILRHPDSFSCGQLENFVNYYADYKAALLYTLICKVPVKLNPAYTTTFEQYVHYLVYIREVEENFVWQDAEFVDLAIQKFSLLYGHTESLMLEVSEGLSKSTVNSLDEGSKFYSLLRKTRDSVLTDCEIKQLEKYGYDSIAARRLNAICIRPNTIAFGKAWYLFAKEALLGKRILTEEEKSFIESSPELRLPLKRAIDSESFIKNVLLGLGLNDECVNANFALKYLIAGGAIPYAFIEEITVDGDLYRSLDKEYRKKILLLRIVYDTECEKVQEYIELFEPEFGPIQKFLDKEMVYTMLQHGSLSIEKLMKGEMSQSLIDFLYNRYFTVVSKLSADVLSALTDSVSDGCVSCYSDYQCYKVKFCECTEDDVRKLYQVKEEYFYRHSPKNYIEFLLSVMAETGDLLHTKEEWLQLKPFFTGSYQIDRFERAVLSEEEYKSICKERRRQEEEEEIARVTQCIEDADTYYELPCPSTIKARQVLEMWWNRAYNDFSDDLYEDSDLASIVSFVFSNKIISESSFLQLIKQIIGNSESDEFVRWRYV